MHVLSCLPLNWNYPHVSKTEKQEWFTISIHVINYLSWLKHHMTISINAWKTFYKIFHAFIIKIQERIGLHRIYDNMIKALYVKNRANIILNAENSNSFHWTLEWTRPAHHPHSFSTLCLKHKQEQGIKKRKLKG